MAKTPPKNAIHKGIAGGRTSANNIPVRRAL
jgi:hypothetical protein